MVNEKLLQYIQENKGRASKADIQTALLESGWKLEDIEAAFAAAENPTVPPTIPSEATNREAFLEEMRRKRAETTPAGPASYPLPPNRPVSRIHPRRTGGPGGIIGFLIRRNIVSNEQQANYVLIGVFIVIMGIAVWIAYSSMGGGHTTTLTPEQQQQLDNGSSTTPEP